MTKELKLNRIEARFLLNFVLTESNIFCSKDKPFFGLSETNLNNVGQDRKKYGGKISSLLGKLQKLDKSFYKK